MDAVRCLALPGVVVALTVPMAGACGDVKGLNAPATPLAVVNVEIGRGARSDAEAPLRMAVIWAAQWLPEPFCYLEPESPEAAAVAAAGCRDIFGVVPQRLGADVPVSSGDTSTASIPFYDLPGADALVGELSGRWVYGTLVLYEDRNGNATLDFACPPRPPRQHGPGRRGDGDGNDDNLCKETDGASRDVIRDATFTTMTAPDLRLCFREGTYDDSAAYYPRSGCPAPPKGFSLVSAGGFSAVEARLALAAGELPKEDPATCGTSDLAETTVSLGRYAGVPVDRSALACAVPDKSGITGYLEPPEDAPSLDTRPWACVAAGNHDTKQLVLAGEATDPCRSVTHYILRGCDQDPDCDSPEWDRTANAPDWWPCGGEAP